MTGSLRALLRGVIDYAGLFPPASLDMGSSLEEYRRWQGHEFGFVLSRFCCPVGRLGEMLASPPAVVSAIGAAAAGRAEWDEVREREAALLNDFQSAAEGRGEIQAYEVRIPADGDVERYYEDLQGFASVDLFAELPWGPGMADSVAAAAEADWLGLKARTGPEVPPDEDLAEFIWSCVSLEVPFKLTAGLHHALRSAAGHGFLNVLTAATLAYVEDLPAAALIEVLRSQDPGDWRFQDESVSWREHELPVDEVEFAREVFVGFGSCSVAEPWNDLRDLGLA